MKRAGYPGSQRAWPERPGGAAARSGDDERARSPDPGRHRRRRHRRARATADVAVRDGAVVAVGAVDETASRVLDADGLLVMPGFVDIHTHYDAQLHFEPDRVARVVARRHHRAHGELRLHHRTVEARATCRGCWRCCRASRACRPDALQEGVTFAGGSLRRLPRRPRRSDRGERGCVRRPLAPCAAT